MSAPLSGKDARNDARHLIPKFILRSLEARRVPSSLRSPRFSNSDASLGLTVACPQRPRPPSPHPLSVTLFNLCPLCPLCLFAPLRQTERPQAPPQEMISANRCKAHSSSPLFFRLVFRSFRMLIRFTHPPGSLRRLSPLRSGSLRSGP